MRLADIAFSSHQEAQRLNALINAILEMPALEHKRIAHQFSVHAAGPLSAGADLGVSGPINYDGRLRPRRPAAANV